MDDKEENQRYIIGASFSKRSVGCKRILVTESVEIVAIPATERVTEFGQWMIFGRVAAVSLSTTFSLYVDII